MRRVPDARLEFKDHGFRRPYSIRRVQAAMPDIAPERLLFSIATSHQEHMQTYQQADIILDPFPHTGGVVGMEQIYMGLPIVTLYGTQAAGRTTSAVLTAMGRKDWIARTPEEYVECAVKLTKDIPALAAVRKVLRDELLASPVVAGYPQAVERAYREMWRTWCA
jgi:predicted O-linked N-acetylglucosamine transferase (SPINDLY family)